MTKTTKITTAMLVALLSFAAVGEASAQGFLGISFGKNRRGKHVGVNIGIPLGHGHRQHRAYQDCGQRHVHCDSCRRWIPGSCERVWVPGRCEQIWVAPVYRTVCDPCGRHRQVLVRAGYYETRQLPGHYDTIQHPGHWETVCGY